MRRNDTTVYKGIYLILMGAMTFVFVFGSFSFERDPRYRNPALVAYAKQFFYTAAFAASSVIDAANTIESTYDAENGRRPETGSVPVLVYHGVVEAPDGSTINLTEKEFRDQIFALKNAGHESITLSELYAYERGEGSLPDRPVLITFDDGRADSYYNADPILAAVGYSAVMYVITAYSSEATPGDYYLSPGELVMMTESGRWEVGSHSHKGHAQFPIDQKGTQGNFYSNFLWKKDEGRAETNDEFVARIGEDFRLSREYLEGLLKRPITTFAFPFGDLGQNQKDAREKTPEILAAAGSEYQMLFYQYRPGEYFTQAIPQKDAPVVLASRIDVQNTWSAEELLTRIAEGSQKALPYDDTFAEDRGWIRVWGDHTIAKGTLVMEANEKQSGAATLLDGSASWKDYSVTADVVSPRGTGVLLWSRFKDDDNNAGCNFGINFVHIEETLNGERKVIKGVRLEHVIPEGPFKVTATATGRTLICSINGVELVRTEFLDEKLSAGGTGLKIWDETLGKSSIVVEQLSVTPVKSGE